MLCWSGFLFSLWQAIIHFHDSTRIRQVFAKLQFAVNYMLRNYEFWQKIERREEKTATAAGATHMKKKRWKKEKPVIYARTMDTLFSSSFSLATQHDGSFPLAAVFICFDFYNRSLSMCNTPSASDINLSMNRKNKLYLREEKRERASERKKDERMSEWCTIESRCY